MFMLLVYMKITKIINVIIIKTIYLVPIFRLSFKRLYDINAELHKIPIQKQFNKVWYRFNKQAGKYHYQVQKGLIVAQVFYKNQN